MTPAAFRNAQVVLQAIGGSTNGLVHLAAIAGRLGHGAGPGRIRPVWGGRCRCLLDLKPTGDHYMEHFHWSGVPCPRLMQELGGIAGRHRPRW